MDEAIDCRICRGNEPPLITPCDCTQGHVHLECLARWANASNRTCEICRVPYRVELPRFSNHDTTKIYLLALIVIFYTAGLACFDVFVTDLSISARAVLAGCQIGLCAAAAFVGPQCYAVSSKRDTQLVSVCVPLAESVIYAILVLPVAAKWYVILQLWSFMGVALMRLVVVVITGA